MCGSPKGGARAPCAPVLDPPMVTVLHNYTSPELSASTSLTGSYPLISVLINTNSDKKIAIDAKYRRDSTLALLEEYLICLQKVLPKAHQEEPIQALHSSILARGISYNVCIHMREGDRMYMYSYTHNITELYTFT